MQSPPMSSQRFRWPYGQYNDDDAVFRIHDRTAFCVILLCSVVFLIVVVFLYTRWVCRLGGGSTSQSQSWPPPSDSAAQGFPPMPSRRRGLDLSEIEKMPIVLYQNMAGSGEKFNEAECCICLAAFDDKDRVKAVPQCRHCFHTECLDEWLTTQSSCPLCRASLRVGPDSFSQSVPEASRFD